MCDYSALSKLGLNKTAVACYESLYKDGSSKASELSKKLHLSQRGVYYALKKLQEWGFIEDLNSILPEVTHYRAVRLDKALENLAIYQRRVVRSITEEQIERSLKLLGNSNTLGKDWR
jgi:sugar-specific transcriptional regulator TrmB